MKHKPPIYFLTTDSKPMRGGVAEHLHRLCEGLGKEFKVEMCSTVQGCFNDSRSSYKIRWLASRPSRDLGKRMGDGFFLTRKWNTCRYYRSLRKQAAGELKSICRERPWVVIGHWSLETHFWCEACRSLTIPYSVVCHGLELLCPLNPLGSLWRKQDLLGARCVVVNSRGTGELAGKAAGGPLDWVVVNPWVNCEGRKVFEQVALNEKRRQLLIPEDARILITVGRLIRRKGVDLVMEAMASLAVDFPNSYYLVVGEGPERENLERLAWSLGIRERVVFLSGVDDEEKWALLAMSDVFVMPNRTLNGTDWEGFGIVFLEAALAGKPSVGGNNGGVPDAILDGETGFLVETKDSNETAQAIRRLLEDEALRVEMGEKARKRVLNDFNGASSARRFAEKMELTKSNPPCPL